MVRCGVHVEGLRYGTVVASAASTSDQTHAWEFAAPSWDPSDFSAAILFVHRVLYRIIMVIKDANDYYPNYRNMHANKGIQPDHAFA